MRCILTCFFFATSLYLALGLLFFKSSLLFSLFQCLLFLSKRSYIFYYIICVATFNLFKFVYDISLWFLQTNFKRNISLVFIIQAASINCCWPIIVIKCFVSQRGLSYVKISRIIILIIFTFLDPQGFHSFIDDNSSFSIFYCFIAI